jgi:organic radical activating enzyme
MSNKINQVNLNIFYGYLCNYSCYGCFCGSDSATTSQFDPDFEKTFNSIQTLSDIFEVSGMISILGGEPFLYWDSRIVPLALEIRRCFPDVRINITSNGQLLGKNVDKIYDLAQKINEFSLTITRHLRAVNNSKIDAVWNNNMNQFLNDSAIVRIHDDHYHVKDNIHANIYFTNLDDWKPHYYTLDNGDIKPWRTNNPEKSMQHGCPGNLCSCLYEDRIYKCPTLATLHGQLSARGQENDVDWMKYLNYPAIDINNIDSELFTEFNNTYGKPTTYCDMCSDSIQKNINWKDRTFPMIFQKQINDS